MKKSIIKNIEFCSQCKFGHVISDPDPDDWFCDDDAAVICVNPDYHPEYSEISKNYYESRGWNKEGYHAIVSSCRPYEIGKLDTIPNNCPLD